MMLVLRKAKAGSLAVNGLTLVEVLIAIAILGFVSTLAIGQSISALRRERINSVALALAGWIEEVRNLSTRKVGSVAGADVGCEIKFLSASSAGLVQGASIATVVKAGQSNCSPQSNSSTHVDGAFVVPFRLNGTISYSITQTGLTSSQPTILYTPRGVWLPSSGASGDMVIKLLLDNGGPMRCLRVSETLAFVDIGQASASSLSSSCTDYQRF